MAKILIIDDDNDVAKALQAALQFVGNQVETATEPEEALLRAGREDFDLVITDLHWGIPGRFVPAAMAQEAPAVGNLE